MKRIFWMFLMWGVCLALCACNLYSRETEKNPTEDYSASQTEPELDGQTIDEPIDDSILEEDITELSKVEIVTDVPTETEIPLTEPEENNNQANDENIDFKLGVYLSSDSPLDTLTIDDVSSNSIRFSLHWHRTNYIDCVTAIFSGNKAVFDFVEKESGQYAKGMLEISYDNTVILTLTESTYRYIEPGIYKYQYFGSEQYYSDSLDYSVLLMNNDQRGWFTIKNPDDIEPTECWLRFYEDGCYVGWIIEYSGGDGYVTGTVSGYYKIANNTLFLDQNGYALHAESTGDTFMYLTAKNSYEIDFSGRYYCTENSFYSYLAENYSHP